MYLGESVSFCFFLSQCPCLISQVLAELVMRTIIAVILNSMHRFVLLWANLVGNGHVKCCFGSSQ
jgi:hypothetical protein